MSAPAWPRISLSEILSQSKDPVPVKPMEKYRGAGILSYGKGLFDKGIFEGADTSYPVLYRLHAGQLVYSRLFAWEGAFAEVTPEYDGAMVSQEFPVFDVDSSRANAKWVNTFISQPIFWKSLAGSGLGQRRVRVQPAEFLTQKIPLPPLEEQNRIVAKLDTLAAKIDETTEITRQATAETNLLAVAMAHRSDMLEEVKLTKGWRSVRLGDVITMVSDDVIVKPTGEYPNFGIYSYGRGLFAKPPISGLETSATKLRRVRAGQFIYSRLFAWEGAYGMVTPEFDGWYVSNEYPTFNCDEDQILTEFLLAYFKAEHVWAAVATGSKGLGGRRVRVQPQGILDHRLLLPPLAWQEQIRTVMNLTTVSATEASERAKHLTALLPSLLDRAFRGAL